ncbi:substrate-binding domain-containing protein [Citrifermentans bremense]|uniref:substrate-binding domain-containing protein n=1 Tax=Citrifermentans bremense TaxID=60035 RepID=UPI00040B851A|nr:substrate-binding domain-containing protein [Citrifermentans bremense]
MKHSFPFRMMIIGFCFLAGCATAQKNSNDTDTIRIGGDAALTEVIAPVAETFEEENPSLRLITLQSKPGTELAALQNDSLDAVVSTVSLERLLKRAAETGPAPAGALFREVPIGSNQTVVFLNDIKIKKLTKKQLKAIFTGKITNWKKVGGPNRRIVVVWSPAADAENELFIREILQRERVVANYVPVANAEEMRKIVLETPGAIGIGPDALVSYGVRVPGSPKIASSVVLITKGEPAPKVQKLLDLIKDVAFLP